jgi:hypothetical protein
MPHLRPWQYQISWRRNELSAALKLWESTENIVLRTQSGDCSTYTPKSTVKERKFRFEYLSRKEVQDLFKSVVKLRKNIRLAGRLFLITSVRTNRWAAPWIDRHTLHPFLGDGWRRWKIFRCLLITWVNWRKWICPMQILASLRTSALNWMLLGSYFHGSFSFLMCLYYTCVESEASQKPVIGHCPQPA